MAGLVNGDMELAAGWTLLGLAAYSTAQAQGGAQSMRLRVRKTFGTETSQCSQTFDVVNGGTYTPIFWIRMDDASNITLRLTVTSGAVEQFTYTLGGVGSGWVQLVWSPFTAAADTATITMTATATNPAPLGTWDAYVDTVSFDLVSANIMAKWEALDALLTALKAINGGANYHHDLGSRVYTREIWPDESPDVKCPYISVVEQPADFNAFESFMDENLRVFVRGFVRTTDADLRDASTVQAVSELHDDILKALRVDDTFSGTVKELIVNSVDTPPPTKDWQGVEFDVVLRVIFDASQLGP